MTRPYRLMPARSQAPLDSAPFHRWTMPDGEVWTAFHRVSGGHLLRFPDLADFLVSSDGLSAACWPTPDLHEATREHLFLNQVLPLMLAEQGWLVFHASSVECGDGAIALLGSSGRGKSTLAAAFVAKGARFLGDDVLVVEPTAGGYLALPSHPSVRLWDDSREALLGPKLELAPPLVYTDKGRVLAAAGLPHCGEPRPLLAAYVLGEGTRDDIAFRALGGAEALAGWLRHGFLLDVEDRARLRTNLDQTADLACAVPTIALDYPRRYEGLERLHRAIVDHALGSEMAA